MTFPYPELVKQLRFHATTAHYVSVFSQHRTRKTAENEHNYKAVLPFYIYAVCPICNTQCSEQIDTYSLLIPSMKHSLLNGEAIRDDYPENYDVPCKHYLGVHTLVNLHGRIPREIDTFTRGFTLQSGEVPYVHPDLIPFGEETYVVLHALPLCRIENSSFIPAYTLFLLTYFARDIKALVKSIYERECKFIKEDREYVFSLVGNITGSALGIPNYEIPNLETHLIPGNIYHGKQKPIYELAYWAAQGKLGWLDFSRDSFELRLGLGNQLPQHMKNISGRRFPIMYLDGKLMDYTRTVLQP